MIVIYGENKKVKAVDLATLKTGVARCHPDDEFDFSIGANLALERCLGKSEKKNDIKVGDYVNIVSTSYVFDSYEEWVYKNVIGDVHKIRYAYGDEPDTSHLFKVLHIAEHEYQKDWLLLYVVDTYNQKCFLIRREGVQKV